MKVYRHGDILISPVEKIPEDARKRPGLVIAEGEVTGHAHRMESSGLVEIYDHDEGIFLVVAGEPARIVHEEHAPIELTSGSYRVWRQREYNPVSYAEYIED